MILSLVLFGCEDNRSKASLYAKGKTISYEEAQLNCQKIKEENPEGSTEDCMCGGRLPDFNAISISGERINSEDLRGKLTIINFWFSTCAPCIAEVPGFNTLVEKYGKDKINFISIARNSKSEVEEFLKVNPWDFEHISNDTNVIDSIFKHEFGYPTTFLLDKNGVIIRSFTGGAVGENAGYFLQKRIVSSIEEALRISPLKTRKHYKGNIGDIEYNPDLDDPSFSLCNGENQINQYFNNGNGLGYKGEKSEIFQIFENNYKPIISDLDNGLLTLRFVVNCKGETNRYRLSEMDNNYKLTNFNKSVTDQILTIAKSLKGWQPKKLEGIPIDYYQILSFKIENGQIIDILP